MALYSTNPTPLHSTPISSTPLQFPPHPLPPVLCNPPPNVACTPLGPPRCHDPNRKQYPHPRNPSNILVHETPQQYPHSTEGRVLLLPACWHVTHLSHFRRVTHFPSSQTRRQDSALRTLRSQAGRTVSEDAAEAPPEVQQEPEQEEEPFACLQQASLAGGCLEVRRWKGDRCLRIWTPPGIALHFAHHSTCTGLYSRHCTVLYCTAVRCEIRTCLIAGPLEGCGVTSKGVLSSGEEVSNAGDRLM